MKINWKKLWRDHSKWMFEFTKEVQFPTWNRQRIKIEELVEAQLAKKEVKKPKKGR
jgi:hypothetical protein